MTLAIFNSLIAYLGLLAICLWIITLISLALQKQSPVAKGLVKHIQTNHLHLTLLFALVATLGSLLYSDYFMLAPCKLCWYQRIFMYPIVVLAIVGLISKDKKAGLYSLWLSLLGSVISLYQIYLQFFAQGYDNCAVVGQNASCSKVWVKLFGFMTIPTMALICFVAIITINLIQRRAK